MLNTTRDVIKAALAADATMDDTQRKAALKRLAETDKPEAAAQAATQPEPLVVSFEVAANTLGVSMRMVRKLAHDGHIRRVYFPGRRNAYGLNPDDVRKLAGKPKSKAA